MPKAQYKCCSVPTPVTTLTLPRRSAVASGSGPIGSCHGLLLVLAAPGRGEGLWSSAGDSAEIAEMTLESSSEVLSRLG